MDADMKVLAKWVAVGALFLLPFIPLLVVNGFFFPFITGKAFAFRILVEIAFAGYALLALSDKRYRPQFSWLGAVLVVFVAWMLLADLTAINPAKAIWSNFERMEGWVTLIHLLALFLVAGSVLTIGGLWRRFWLTSLGASVLVGLYGLMQLTGLADIHQGSSRLDASLGNSEYLAAYFLFHVFIASWLAVGEWQKDTWLKYALPALAVVEAFLLFETQTRGAVLGLVLGALAAALLGAVIAGGNARKYGAIVAVVILVLSGSFFLARDSSFVQQNSSLARIASGFSFGELATRLTLWHMAAEGVAEHPVLGWGQEGYNYVFNKYYEPSLYGQESWFDRAHNSFVDWLVAGGIPAFLLYLSIFALAFWLLFKRPEFTLAERVGISALLVAYAVYSFFVFDNLITSVLFILVIAYVHQRSATPIKYFEALPEMDAGSAGTVGAPVAAVALLVVLYFVNVPGISASTQLITALSPSQNGVAGTVAAFKDYFTHPAFGTQEGREQLVSAALGVANNPSASAEDKTAIVTLAIGEMQKQVAELPLDPRGYLELALAYRIAGDDADALKQDLIAEGLSPMKEAIYLEEGSTQLEAGNLAKAKEAFDKAYALGPQFPQLALYAAEGAILVGDTKTADALLLKSFGTTTVDNEQIILAYYSIKDWPHLIALLKQYVKDQHGTANSYFRLAAGYVSAGDLGSAKLAVEAGMAADPNAVAQGKTLLSELAAMAAQGAK